MTEPGLRLTFQEIANLLHIHRNTLRYKLKQAGLYEHYHALSDQDLNVFVHMFKQQRPDSGLAYLAGFLHRHGVKVQCSRIRSAYQRVDRLGQTLRKNKPIHRREYRNPHPNYLWHLDGHHKLIRWGIVIHGIIDGYCRTVSKLFISLINYSHCVFRLLVFMPVLIIRHQLSLHSF